MAHNNANSFGPVYHVLGSGVVIVSGKFMKKTLRVLLSGACVVVACSGIVSGAVGNDAVIRAQSYLSKLGYQPGPVDGAYGRKTAEALGAFYQSFGASYGGKIDASVLAALVEEMAAHNIRIEPLAGYEIENFDGEMLYAPPTPGKTKSRYAFGHLWVNEDWNGDGLRDFLYTGTMVATNTRDNSVDTGDWCGKGKTCDGAMPGPTLYLAQNDGTYREAADLFIDKRAAPGQSLARQNLVGDLNGDGVSDLFIADHGAGSYNGFRDSYFLSQPDGTWIESSATHLSDSNYRVFDHGAAIGDIDNDGDLDIVITELANRLSCWINDGKGKLTKRGCGDVFAFGIELGDINGDGFLDLVHAAHEYEGTRSGVALNDGTGKFRRVWKLPENAEWGTVPEVAVWDLDGDGDLDIVLSRAKKLYVGTAIEVLENLGEGEFKSKFYPLVEAPADYKPTSEGNEWNDFVSAVRFSDVNGDGLSDIFLVGGGYGPTGARVRGAVLLNKGNMDFEHKRNREPENPVTILDESLFIDDPASPLRLYPEGSKEAQQAQADTPFSIYVAGQKPAQTHRDNYEILSKAILLPKSGARVLGFRQVELGSNGGRYGVLLEWAGHELFATACVQHHAPNKFTAHRLRFGSRSFGGIADLSRFGTHICQGAEGYAGHWEIAEGAEDIGIKALLEDFNEQGVSIIDAIPSLTGEKKAAVMSSIFR
jgi:hypothetical protein